MDDNRDATDSGVAHRPEERNYDEERANLRHFFENIWEQDAKYLVFFTRKCFNLNQRFFLEALREETIGLVIRGRFLSQNALLALAPSLAEQYHEQGRFPSMLLADELASYGRAISSYMVALETSVFHAYQSLYGLPDNKAEWKLRTAFLDAIQIRVYMGHRQKLYLETRFQKRLKFEYPQTELFRSRSLMQWIPLWLRQEDVELTSYAPFFRLTLGEYKRFCVHMDQEEAWHRRLWLYHGLKSGICQKIELYSSEGIQLLQTFRCHAEKDGFVRVVPLSLFRGISFSALDSLCKELAETLKAATNVSEQMRYIYELLSGRIHIEEASHVRLQMISFLLSVTLFYEVIDGAGISWVPDNDDDNVKTFRWNHDLDKVAVNFGQREDVYGAFLFLCGKNGAELRAELRKVLMFRLKAALIPFENSANDCFGGKPGEIPPFEADQYFRMAEDFFHEAGLRDERSLPEVHGSGIGYSAGIRSDIYDFLQTYYRKMKGMKTDGTFRGRIHKRLSRVWQCEMITIVVAESVVIS